MRKSWLPVALALLLGAGFGFAAAGKLSGHYRRHRGDTGWMLEKFSKELQLTPEQQAQVGAILEAKRQKIDALRAEMKPRFEEVRAGARAEIRPLLTPEQQVKFEALEAKWQRRKERFGRSGGSRG